MQKTAPALVVTHVSGSTPSILLVKTISGWSLPVGKEGEDVPALIERVEKDLLPPANAFEVLTGYHKTVHPDTGDLEVTLGRCHTGELRSFIESEDWFHAKFTSFEEASYIINPDHAKLLSWCERVVPNALGISDAS